MPTPAICRAERHILRPSYNNPWVLLRPADARRHLPELQGAAAEPAAKTEAASHRQPTGGQRALLRSARGPWWGAGARLGHL